MVAVVWIMQLQLVLWALMWLLIYLTPFIGGLIADRILVIQNQFF